MFKPRTIGVYVLAAGASAHAQMCGTLWTQLSPATSPPVRYNHAMAGDTARARVVLFGGYYGSARLGDTWEWDGAAAAGAGNWALRSTTGPSPRESPAMTYDSARGRTVLFGGESSTALLADTWEWDGTSWLQRSGSGPSPRSGAAMAYDAARQRTVLFGGYGNSRLADTWEWDGIAGAWSQRFPAHSPPPGLLFQAPGLAFDPLGGGVLAVAWPEQTWRWDGADWTLLAATSPPSATPNTIAYDAVRQRVVLYSVGQTWEWGGSTWVLRASTGPAYRQGNALAFDAARGRIIALVEALGSGGSSAATWEWVGDTAAAPTLTQWPMPTAVNPGEPAIFRSAAAGTESPRYQWYRNGAALSDGGIYSGTQTPVLTVVPNSVAIGGTFSVTVTNLCGATTAGANLTVICYPNCDWSTNYPFLNVDDFVCFQSRFAAGSDYANCDHSTAPPVLNVNDFICFITAFAAGCP